MMTGSLIPGSPYALVDSVNWWTALLTGTIGNVVAVIAIAWLGFMMFEGHLQIRGGIRVVIGCFILFGAPLIAAGLMSASHGVQAMPVPPPAPAPTPIATPKKPPSFDPYAGASVPNQ